MFIYGDPPNRTTFYYDAQIGNPKESFGIDKSRIVMTYLCAYGDRFRGRNALLGVHGYQKASPSFIRRTKPHSLPDNPLFYAVAVSEMGRADMIEPDLADRFPNAAFARLTVTYEPLPYKVLSDAEAGPIVDESLMVRNTKKEFSSGMRWVTGIPGEWVWNNSTNAGRNGKPAPFPLPIPIPKLDLVYTWYNVPEDYVPWGYYTLLEGRSNADLFDSYAAETLVFTGAKPHRKVWHDGTYVYDVTVNVQHYPRGCNKYLDPANINLDGSGNQVFTEVVAKNNAAVKPFPTCNFNLLFRPI